MMLTRLIYTSRYVPGNRGPLSDFRAILESSRANNYVHHVTGFLFFDKRNFLQILEGNGLAVDTIFDRIQGDVRHEDIAVIARSRIARRRFAVWAMGGVVRSPVLDPIFADYGILDDFPDNLPEDVIVDFCEDVLKFEDQRLSSRVLRAPTGPAEPLQYRFQ
ncbi:BLUF domain-containing protein [Asticcacaulis benevestitus]|nr:BLUF domain-containing protein [Asticcacaulis benevestitus]